MNTNVGKYRVELVKENLIGKKVKCELTGVDGDIIDLGIGDTMVVEIVDACYEIDPEGYWWELDVIIQNPDTPIPQLTDMKFVIMTNLDTIDNFYEQDLAKPN